MAIPVLIISASLLLALVLSLVLKPFWSSKLTTASMVIGICGGLIFYGFGIAETGLPLPICILRTTFCVIRMFLGVPEYAVIEHSFFLSTRVGQFLYWLVHILAFYSIASAAMVSLGTTALRQLRLLLSRRGNLTLIYGISEDNIALGRECLREEGGSVIFIEDNTVAPGIETSLNNQNMALFTGAAAVSSDRRFLRRLHLKNRTLTVYAIKPDVDNDLTYAFHLRDSLERLGIPAEKTSLTLPGTEDILASMLQVSPTQYGFGFVNVYDPADLTAKALIRTCPPWDFLSFDENGRAKEDFSCVIVGFGRRGQAVLRHLIMNGQFSGSTFHATVFSNNYGSEAGRFFVECPELLNNYDISGYIADGRSRTFYEYIDANLVRLKMIAVCTGSEEMNHEISDQLMLHLQRRSAERICVVQCGADGVRYQERVGSPILKTEIYSRDFLSAQNADREAILLNASYDTSARSDWDKWIACDSFSKMSSRASAAFIPAFIKASHSSREAVLAGEWSPDGTMLEVLGETEHLRWCAFHSVMGYSPMPRAQFEENAAIWARCKAEGVPCPVRISKDPVARFHACLVPWEELDALSELENSITGGSVDYKQLDINNVLALPRLLQAQENAKKKS